MNLEVNIAGIVMKNPVMTASGTYGFGQCYSDIVSPDVWGALVTKSIRLNKIL